MTESTTDIPNSLANALTEAAPTDAASAWERAQRFVDASTEGIAFYRNGLVLDCNLALEKILQRSRAQIIGAQVIGFFPERDRVVAERHIHMGRNMPYPANLLRADGTEIEVEISGREADYAGQPCSVAAVRDTSNVARITESLMRSQARYRSLVENADRSVIFVQEGKITYSNPAASTFFQTESNALLQTESICLIHPDDRDAVLLRRNALLSGTVLESFEARTISPPSEYLQAHTRVSWCQVFGTMVDWTNKPALLLFLTDMTAQRESEEKMRHALSQEKELGDLKTRFVSMASHEFRTPLATIQTSSELLDHYHERLSPEQRREAVHDIQQSVQRIQAMINNFMSFGRMAAGTMHARLEAVPVQETMRTAVAHSATADGHQHLIVLEHHASVPAALQLMLDETLFQQIVGNLVGNACKYSAAGTSVQVWLERVERAHAPWLLLRVRDQGIGIPEGDLPHLFGSFVRASNAGAVKGTGLGLAIVQRALDAHGGSIAVRSELGRGSAFEALLPWQEASGLAALDADLSA
jgi:PAS domain S-box-containing protein